MSRFVLEVLARTWAGAGGMIPAWQPAVDGAINSTGDDPETASRFGSLDECAEFMRAALPDWHRIDDEEWCDDPSNPHTPFIRAREVQQ